MKLTFIGAGGVRTPLVIESVMGFQDRIPFTEACLMDINAENLDLMRMVTEVRLRDRSPSFKLTWTTDPIEAITGADFIVMTFRQGGIASRVIDEQVPLKYEVLGQETTGPGGFAMAMRTIPVLLDYVKKIQELAPEAWLINFTNPAGIVTEAVTKFGGFERVIGICDNPSAMHRSLAKHFAVGLEDLFLEYYGLNHLGWMSGVYLNGENKVPQIIEEISKSGSPWHWLPFDPAFIASLGVIPNEYLLFYYYPRRSVENYIKAGQSRAQQIQPFNDELYASLRTIRAEGSDPERVMVALKKYLQQRHGTYMTIETGESHEEYDEEGLAQAEEEEAMEAAAEGYSGVALRVIEALTQNTPMNIILNVPNKGAITGMKDDDVVEVNCHLRDGLVRPFAVGPIPDHALGLMKRVKAYERLTIDAAVDGSYSTAVKALALHPLLPSYEVAKAILDDYIESHGKHFPSLV
jgi:6-phospho-beta-glucosidase